MKKKYFLQLFDRSVLVKAFKISTFVWYGSDAGGKGRITFKSKSIRILERNRWNSSQVIMIMVTSVARNLGCLKQGKILTSKLQLCFNEVQLGTIIVSST